MTQQHNTVVPEGDLLKTLLSEVKRVAGEYTTAITESNCMVVRQMFTQLLQDSLSEQEQIYQILNSQGQYQTPSPASGTDVQKEIQQSSQRRQQTWQLMQQYQQSMPTAMGWGMTGTQHQMMPGVDLTRQNQEPSQRQPDQNASEQQ